jgi:iron(III) transport system substrate-binding protein
MEKKTQYFVIAGIVLLIAIACIVLSTSRQATDPRTVVVYTSVDQVYSEPVFRDFENRTGIRVLPVYDVEATKTTGLVNRLIAEKNRPQADVFWCAEFSQMILLKNQSVLAPYQSPSGTDIPAQYHDRDGFWTGVGGRGRVFIVNTDLLKPAEYPRTLNDMLDPRYPGTSVGIAYPMFGTTATQAAALYSTLGREKAHGFYDNLSRKGIRVVDGNSVVKDLVSSGQLAFGLTDTDDACTAMADGRPVAIVVPDQGEGEMGTLVIPDTVALIAGAPHSVEGKAFIDYILDKNTENSLVESGWIQIPSRNVTATVPCLNGTVVRPMAVDYQDVYEGIRMTKTELAEIFVR